MRRIGKHKLYRGDCLKIMSKIPEHSVDMVLCDLPYGTTQHKWDAVIPFDALWEQYRRVVKSNGAIVLFAAQPFTSTLICSNLKAFKYQWVWHKNLGSNFANSKRQPMRYHEDIVVFYEKQCVYNGQRTQRVSLASERTCARPVTSKPKHGMHGSGLVDQATQYDPKSKGPESVLRFDGVPNAGGGKLHPTQKPVDLLEYLIRTYTNPGMTVLDNTAGSGSTLVACVNTGRVGIGIEKDPKYYDVMKTRVRAARRAQRTLKASKSVKKKKR